MILELIMLGSLLMNTNSFATYEATAYCPCSYCNGNSLSVAKNGTPLEPNVTIAVDDDVIPLGSMVYIKGLGFRRADDTGSAIKGHRIDVLFPTHGEALEFGRRNIEVYVFDLAKEE